MAVVVEFMDLFRSNAFAESLPWPWLCIIELLLRISTDELRPTLYLLGLHCFRVREKFESEDLKVLTDGPP